ncbi:MAG TPA: sigma-70 family RNA polymerase sigma factor [Gemmataceae bacterium]|nr:sigma-70 family RNA polymerase sigma factor [Gemmataceae bacterium]
MKELSTTSLRELIVRFQSGEISALDYLIRRTEERLEQFARRMLASFPRVRAREGTDDVLQSALVRLTRALRQQTPESVRDFFNLAAVQIRRELLDLARSHARRPAEQLEHDPPEAAEDSAELDRWTRLHEAVEELPPEMRDVFSYTFYHGWTQAQIAELLGISDRQVRRLWVEACLRLKAAVVDLPAG